MPHDQAMNDVSIAIAYASETGFVEEIAGETEDDLESAGITAQLMDLAELDSELLEGTTTVLFMVSTTGDGDPPWTARNFSDKLMSAPAALSHLNYGLLAAGDSSYPTFCGFGHSLDQWLQASGAQPLFSAIYVDSEDETSVQQWLDRVIQVFDHDDVHEDILRQQSEVCS